MKYQTLSAFHKKIIPLVIIGIVVLQGVSSSFGQEEQTLILTTNKNSYLPGDTVQLNGNISNQSGLLVAIQIKDSSGNLILIRTIQTDNQGNFFLQFKIPSTATSGDFSVVASAKINGFVISQTKTITATVPEFSFSSIVLMFSVIIMILFYRFSIT